MAKSGGKSLMVCATRRAPQTAPQIGFGRLWCATNYGGNRRLWRNRPSPPRFAPQSAPQIFVVAQSCRAPCVVDPEATPLLAVAVLVGCHDQNAIADPGADNGSGLLRRVAQLADHDIAGPAGGRVASAVGVELARLWPGGDLVEDGVGVGHTVPDVGRIPCLDHADLIAALVGVLGVVEGDVGQFEPASLAGPLGQIGLG